MNEISHKKSILFILLAATDILVLDFFSKKLAVFYQGEQVELVGKYFWLDFYQTNTGIAFSLPVPSWIQITLTFLILGLLIYWAKDLILKSKKHPFLKAILFGMILGGAIGNLIDRILQGYVVDFIHLGPIPVFNIADVGIVIGVLGLAIMNIKSE